MCAEFATGKELAAAKWSQLAQWEVAFAWIKAAALALSLDAF